MRLLPLVLLAAPLFAQTAGVEFFEAKVRPIFAAKCYACHGPKLQMASLNLSASADAVVVKGDPAQSRLYRAVSYNEDIKMPPTGKLSPEEIATLKTWIEQGAAWPATTAPAVSGKRVITDKDRQHWAFRPIQDPPPPHVRNQAWAKNAIDAFVLSKLEEKGLQPAPPAPKRTLIRRVTYDLTGLPPTPREVAAFLADKSPNAFAKVVDRLLATPQYGERWGRHWLDVARYADSTGMDEDHIYPDGWRYRDYVVKAFNADMPYDQFVREQLAGDLLPAKSEADRDRGIIATGFLALGPKPLAQQDRVQMIYDVVDEQIDTTSKAFLGLTVACARCHDHKFDPILTRDYYALASIFASTMDFRNLGRPGSVSYMYEAPLDRPAYAEYQDHRWRMYGKQLEMEDAAGDDWTRENALLRPKIASLLTAAWSVHATKSTPAEAAAKYSVEPKQLDKWVRWLESADEKARTGYLKNWYNATDGTIAQVAAEYQQAYGKDAEKFDHAMENWRKRYAIEVAQDRDLPARPKPDPDDQAFFAAATFNGGPLELADSERVAQLRREWKALQASLPQPPPMANAVCDGPQVEQHVFLHGDHHSPGQPVAKTFPIVLAGDSQQPVAKGSGRLELAEWLTRPDHPLTARVLVNRIWQWHFGEALMRTPNNWGKTGDVPVETELLDYLATRFIQSGWSVKSMHRMILLSNTYQMSSRASQEARELDPTNRLCSRFNRTRMSVEQIRDSILALDGSLDETLGGSLLPTGKREKVDTDDLKRRTIYIPVRRGSVPTVLATFDFGDATSPSDGRPRTNVAPQALFLMNSRFVIERSRGFAKRLLDDATLTDAQRIQRAYDMALTRPPESAEIDEAISYIATLEKRLPGPGAHLTAWQSFCHILISTNEFLYLD